MVSQKTPEPGASFCYSPAVFTGSLPGPVSSAVSIQRDEQPMSPEDPRQWSGQEVYLNYSLSTLPTCHVPSTHGVLFVHEKHSSRLVYFHLQSGTILSVPDNHRTPGAEMASFKSHLTQA